MKKTPKKKFFPKKKKTFYSPVPSPSKLENLRLNKFLAHCGVGTRRACDVFIQEGLVTVNDEIVKESAYRVQKDDVVKYEGKVLEIDKKYTYILLNKPKNYHPTFEEIEGEKTFQNIFSNKIQTKISSIGNLEKESLGLLFFTDDEVLVKKFLKGETSLHSIFNVMLDNPVDLEAFQKTKGSLIQKNPNIRSVNLVKEKEILVEMRGGSDLDLKKIFEEIGFEIKKVDRVLLNDLTKKDLPRGRFRFLTEKEIIFLKHFSR